MAHELPALPYEKNALEPVITQETIEYHYGKHHAAYVANLNKLVPEADLSLEDLIAKVAGDDSKKGILIDPGDEPDRLLRTVGFFGVEITGIFNTEGPGSALSTAGLIHGIKAVTSTPSDFTWVDWDFLIKEGETPQNSLPFWQPPRGSYLNYGRMVNVSSGAGSITVMNGRTAAYKVSKVALNALTRIVADEVRGYNIKVNTMCPGWVRTEMGGLRREAWRKRRIPLSGWRCWAMTARPAAFFGIESRFRGRSCKKRLFIAQGVILGEPYSHLDLSPF